jgi:hypothetical protein
MGMTPREECLALAKTLTFRSPGYWWAEKVIERKKKGFTMPSISVQFAEETLGYHKDETDL